MKSLAGVYIWQMERPYSTTHIYPRPPEHLLTYVALEKKVRFLPFPALNARNPKLQDWYLLLFAEYVTIFLLRCGL